MVINYLNIWRKCEFCTKAIQIEQINSRFVVVVRLTMVLFLPLMQSKTRKTRPDIKVRVSTPNSDCNMEFFGSDVVAIYLTIILFGLIN